MVNVSDVLQAADAVRVLNLRDTRALKIRGEGWVLGFKENGPRTYDEYLGLGFAQKKITESLCQELVRDHVLEQYCQGFKPRTIFGHQLAQHTVAGRRIPFLWKKGNLIVNAGLLQTVNLVTGNISSYTQSPAVGWFAFCGVGSGTSTPAAGDTDLTGPYIGSRLQVSAAYNINSNVAKWDTYVAPATWQGTWYECGNFTSITTGSGAMGSHLLVNPSAGYSKGNNSAILDIQWTL
jgi:hypothetical protein